MDAIVLRVGVKDFKPLPLGGDVQVGDSVWCLSDPRGERGYFSTGIVNRVRVATARRRALQRINVSTDWAPGSSGAAVLEPPATSSATSPRSARSSANRRRIRPESKPGETVHRHHRPRR